METTKKPVKPYPAELRERAVRMVREHASEHASEWAAMRSIAEKVGSVRPRRCGCGCARRSVTGASGPVCPRTSGRG